MKHTPPHHVRLLSLVFGAGLLAVAAGCTPAPSEETPSEPSTGGISPARGGSGGSTPSGTGGGAGGSTTSSGGTSGGGTGGGAGGSSTSSGGAGGGSPTSSGGTSGGSGGASGQGGSTGSDAAAEAGGGTPDAGSTPTPGGPFPPGPHKVVLVYSTDHNGLNLPQADPSLRHMWEILEGMKATHNIVPERILDDEAKAANLKDRALIIVGPNVKHGSVDPAFKEIAVPLIASKDLSGITRLGLGTMVNTPEYTAGLPVKITIINPEHPLAAGFKGTVGVLSTRCRLVRGTNLGPGAIKVATAPLDPASSWSIFAYEKGGEMPGGFKAPAKRVGFFWHRPSAATPEGKKLFEAAVEWAIRP